MKRFLLTLIYTYSLTAPAADLYVQSRAISDLYGDAFVRALNAKQVIYLDRQARPADVTHAVTTYAKAHSYDNLVLIGQYHSIGASKHVPVLTQFVIPDFLKNKPVYVLQGASRMEQERREALRLQTPITQEFMVDSDYTLRKALVSLRQLPQGFVFINVFSLKDSWGEKRSYLSIEDVVTEYKTGHVEVGVCHPGYKTALAVGPTINDVELVLKGESSVSVCASLERLQRLGRMELYTQSLGKFYRVKPIKD